MNIYPISGIFNYSNNINYKSNIPHKEIKEVGSQYIKRSETAKDSLDMYDLAKRYFHGEIIRLLEYSSYDKSKTYQLFRNEVINAASSRLELDFNPEFLAFRKNAKEYTLEKEKKTFKTFVGTINSIAKHWKSIEDKEIK